MGAAISTLTTPTQSQRTNKAMQADFNKSIDGYERAARKVGISFTSAMYSFYNLSPPPQTTSHLKRASIGWSTLLIYEKVGCSSSISSRESCLFQSRYYEPRPWLSRTYFPAESPLYKEAKERMIAEANDEGFSIECCVWLQHLNSSRLTQAPGTVAFYCIRNGFTILCLLLLSGLNTT